MIANWQLPTLAGLNEADRRIQNLEMRLPVVNLVYQNPEVATALSSRQPPPPPPSLAAVAAHFRAIEQARITALHQQADTEHWHGQIFKRLEEA